MAGSWASKQGHYQMNNQTEGATPEPEKKGRGDNCLGRSGRAHKMEWHWSLGVWTDKVQCANCGLIKIARPPDAID